MFQSITAMVWPKQSVQLQNSDMKSDDDLNKEEEKYTISEKKLLNLMKKLENTLQTKLQEI